MLKEHIQTVDKAKRQELMAEILEIVYNTAELTSCYARPLPVAANKDVNGINTAFKHIIAGELWKA
jgi:hypothetical protein